MSVTATLAGCATIAGAPQLYRRRRPERTVLYRVVQQQLETWLARTHENDPDGFAVSATIERELRRYLTCGILAHGFARARCGGCGHDFLVAFSCKGRGICPSCTTRRMVETAAHLVDHVFPNVAVRQWVITFPKLLRYFLHRDPALLNRVMRIVLRAIETRLRRACPGAPKEARFGAVSFPQRFEAGNERIRYTLPKPMPDGQTTLTLTPLELLDRLAALIPPPRRHRHHYHGAFAPHSPLRKAVTACAGRRMVGDTPLSAPVEGQGAPPLPPQAAAPDVKVDAKPTDSPARRLAAYAWVRLLARIYEVLPLVCPRCGTEMRLIAFITQSDAIGPILTHLGEPVTPPPLAPRARAPPELASEWREHASLDQSPRWDLSAPPAVLNFEFDQSARA